MLILRIISVVEVMVTGTRLELVSPMEHLDLYSHTSMLIENGCSYNLSLVSVGNEGMIL